MRSRAGEDGSNRLSGARRTRLPGCKIMEEVLEAPCHHARHEAKPKNRAPAPTLQRARACGVRECVADAAPPWRSVPGTSFPCADRVT